MQLQECAALIEGFVPNKRGHDKHHPRFILQTNPHSTGAERDELGHARKSYDVYKMYDKIRALMLAPEYFAELGFVPTTTPTQKHGGQYIQIRRTDGRESLVAVAQYFIAYLEPISCKVGVRAGKKDGSFLVLDRQHILDNTGLSYDSFNEAVKEMIKLKMVERQRCWAKDENGNYRGKPSQYTLLPNFFEYFNIAEEFKAWTAWVYKKAAKAAVGALDKLAKGLATRFKSNADPASVQPKTMHTDGDPNTLAYYQQRLPKTKHGEFQYQVAMMAMDYPDVPKSELYQRVFQSM